MLCACAVAIRICDVQNICLGSLTLHTKFVLNRPSLFRDIAWTGDRWCTCHSPLHHAPPMGLTPGLCSTQIFRADSTLTHVTIQVIQLRLNSTLSISWLTQLRINSNPKFAYLTQLRLNSFESELSQIWLTTHHILPDLGKSYWPGGGGGECGWM